MDNYADLVLEMLELPDGVVAYEEEGDLIIEGITPENQAAVDEAVVNALHEFDYEIVSDETEDVLADDGETVISQTRTISMVPNDLISQDEMKGKNTFATQ